MTLPTILAYARGSEEERRFWRDAVAGFANEKEDFEQATSLIRSHNAVSDTRDRARHFAQRACDALSIFPANKARSAMIEAARFAVSRGY